MSVQNGVKGLVRMRSGGSVHFLDGTRGSFVPDAKGEICIPESLVAKAIELGFVMVHDAPPAPVAIETEAQELVSDGQLRELLAHIGAPDVATAKAIIDRASAELVQLRAARDGDFVPARQAWREALSPEAEATYDEARIAGLSHADALELATIPKAPTPADELAPVGG